MKKCLLFASTLLTCLSFVGCEKGVSHNIFRTDVIRSNGVEQIHSTSEESSSSVKDIQNEDSSANEPANFVPEEDTSEFKMFLPFQLVEDRYVITLKDLLNDGWSFEDDSGDIYIDMILDEQTHTGNLDYDLIRDNGRLTISCYNTDNTSCELLNCPIDYLNLSLVNENDILKTDFGALGKITLSELSDILNIECADSLENDNLQPYIEFSDSSTNISYVFYACQSDNSGIVDEISVFPPF